MKKLTIFLTILIFLIGGLIGGYFIGQNAETIKSWFEKEPTQQEQEIPDDQEPEKVEITDFAFYGNTVYRYSGDDKVITIPSSYSVEYEKVEEKRYLTSDEWGNSLVTDGSDYVYNLYQPLRITFENAEVEPMFFSGGYYEMATSGLDPDFDIDSAFPATIEFFKATYYEGDDYIVENVGEYFAYSNPIIEDGSVNNERLTCETVILPSTIKQIDYYFSLQIRTLKELVILNEDQVLTVGGPEDLEVPLTCKIYVPDSLFEEYTQSFEYPTERLYKLSERGVVAW